MQGYEDLQGLARNSRGLVQEMQDLILTRKSRSLVEEMRGYARKCKVWQKKC